MNKELTVVGPNFWTILTTLKIRRQLMSFFSGTRKDWHRNIIAKHKVRQKYKNDPREANKRRLPSPIISTDALLLILLVADHLGQMYILRGKKSKLKHLRHLHLLLKSTFLKLQLHDHVKSTASLLEKRQTQVKNEVKRNLQRVGCFSKNMICQPPSHSGPSAISPWESYTSLTLGTWEMHRERRKPNMHCISHGRLSQDLLRLFILF